MVNTRLQQEAVSKKDFGEQDNKKNSTKMGKNAQNLHSI